MRTLWHWWQSMHPDLQWKTVQNHLEWFKFFILVTWTTNSRILHIGFQICGDCLFVRSNLEKRRIERFVQANPQLRCLEINDEIQFSRLLKMISRNTMILKLVGGTPGVHSRHVKRTLLLRFAREHRELVELDFIAFLLRADDAIAFIRELHSLEYFRFRIKDHAACYYFMNQLQTCDRFYVWNQMVWINYDKEVSCWI